MSFAISFGAIPVNPPLIEDPDNVDQEPTAPPLKPELALPGT